MKKIIIAFGFFSTIVLTSSCKNNKKQEENKMTQSTSQPGETEPATNGEPKTYSVTATPDSVSLGKNKEAFIKIKDLKAIELSDPEGKITGIELTYKVELTNKNAIGNSSVGLQTTDFRLELDNGNKIAPASVYVAAQPEETKTSNDDKFEIPAGAKPTVLHLFYDETRASVKLQLK